jgi:hypothetical protein
MRRSAVAADRGVGRCGLESPDRPSASAAGNSAEITTKPLLAMSASPSRPLTAPSILVEQGEGKD